MTDPAMLDELLQEVATDERDAFTNNYRALAQLPAADCDVQTFLDDYLQLVVDLYAATAGAIWFRATDSNLLTAKSTLGLDHLGLDEPARAAHEALLQYGLSQARSCLVKPFSLPQARANVANPTDSFVLLGPVLSHGDRIAIVELFLGPTPLRAKTAGDRNRYVLWLDHLLAFLCQGIEQRFLGNLAPLQPALTNLEATRAEIASFKDAIRISLEVTLNNYAGWNFGSLRNNQTFVRNVHELLESNSLRVECPECGSPAILRCQSAGNAKTGVFMYDHYLSTGRTFHGGPTTFPRVKLVARPPRRRRT